MSGRRASVAAALVVALTVLNVALIRSDATDPRWIVAQAALTAAALVAMFWEPRHDGS